MNPKQVWSLGIVFVFLLAAYTIYLWVSWPDWDPSPNNRIISFQPGFVEIDANYIVPFQVWGDGRIIWVEYAQDHSRRVLEGHLSLAQLKDLVGKFSKAGFFNPFANLIPNPFQKYRLQNLAGGSFQIRLRNGESSRYIDSTDSMVSELASYLGKGAGAFGKNYTPTQGRLYVVLASDIKDLPKNIEPEYQWPDQKFGYTLGSMYKNGGSENDLKGDELAFAWKVVNSPVPFVESGGVKYWIAIHIPGISFP
jgi:hypothetical protein